MGRDTSNSASPLQVGTRGLNYVVTCAMIYWLYHLPARYFFWGGCFEMILWDSVDPLLGTEVGIGS